MSKTAGRCPSCNSRQPSMHPATSYGGEVIYICPDSFHDGDPVTEEARARAAEQDELAHVDETMAALRDST